MVGKEAGTHRRKDMTAPQEPCKTQRPLSSPEPHSAEAQRLISEKHKSRYFPPIETQPPPGHRRLRIVSHERRRERSPYVHFQALEHLWMFCSPG